MAYIGFRNIMIGMLKPTVWRLHKSRSKTRYCPKNGESNGTGMEAGIELWACRDSYQQYDPRFVVQW